MNKAKLKTYAPQARKDFIAAVVARANLLGISEKDGKLEIAPSEKKGDVTLIAGQAWPAKVHEQRERLIKRMQKVSAGTQSAGFGETAEAIAYTWFNRFAALRFMEIHDYLGHGHPVLSSPEGGLPEILTHATELAGILPGLNATRVADMKLAGNKDGELYRLLLVAQCNALSSAMPFLFERIDDETELLLPDNLLRTDSIVAKLVAGVSEEDWAEVEIIGWLYQFYISEKKDQVIGKVVKSEDIPAATQLFTPNWIVQYLVQNSVGRLWLMTNPASGLKSQWPYYIEPAEQTPEVQTQLDALIKTRMDEDGGSLNPETITVLDPACGSGHILVEAYEVLKAIYLEGGYQARVIPRLILEKNLYGLDIDDRAAQMAGFALMMKARADDRRLLENPIKLNVLSLQESKGLELDEFDSHLKPFGISRALIASLFDTFAHAKTFGSLIQVSEALAAGLPSFVDGLVMAIQSGDVFAQTAAQDLVPLVGQATVLSMKFDAVVANPPYMGGQYQIPIVKEYLKLNFTRSKSDLFSSFIERCINFSAEHTSFGFVTPFVWMFLSSYMELRHILLEETSITSLIQLEYNAFEPACIPVCAFLFSKTAISDLNGSYIRLSEFKGIQNQAPKALEAIKDKACKWRFDKKNSLFSNVPSSIFAYSYPQWALDAFNTLQPLSEYAELKQGLITGDNNRFLRLWHEVDLLRSSIKEQGIETVWFPYQKGGAYRKWYGNNEYVVNWGENGKEIRSFFDKNGKLRSRPQNINYFFREGLTWGSLTISSLSMRYVPTGFIFSDKGPMCFAKYNVNLWELLGYANSVVIDIFLKEIAPTMDYSQGPVGSVPFSYGWPDEAIVRVKEMVEIARKDWDSHETSWDFASNPLVQISKLRTTSKECWLECTSARSDAERKLCQYEVENDAFVIEKFGLQNKLFPVETKNQVTLTRSSCEKDSQRLISYAIGYIMGRYSLDEPGLIYASADNIGFDVTRYKTFPADADGIVPISDERWFEDDATNRVGEFMNTVWGVETLEENMNWLAESIGKKGTEMPDETIRRYLSGCFYKDHLQTYKKRPIYWQFSSGKQAAFQALVYLHRYHEGTLARMRAEYVVPLTGKMWSRIEMLEKDRDVATATATRTKITKQIESLKKKHVELLAYDEKLRHYADMRIQLDLDDGVKVNYGKFGDLLAEVKAVTGGAGDE